MSLDFDEEATVYKILNQAFKEKLDVIKVWVDEVTEDAINLKSYEGLKVNIQNEVSDIIKELQKIMEL